MQNYDSLKGKAGRRRKGSRIVGESGSRFLRENTSEVWRPFLEIIRSGLCSHVIKVHEGIRH